MLTPEYLESCTQELLGMMDIVSEQVAQDIARRIVKMGELTETAEFQSWLLMQSNILYDEVIRNVSSTSDLTNREVRKVFRDAHNVNIQSEKKRANAQNIKNIPALNEIMKAQLIKAGKDIKNLTLTTANQAQLSFINACSLANMQVNSGVFTYEEATKRAIKSIAKDGAWVQYPTGHRSRLDVAIKRAVLTGVNQTASKVNLMLCDEFGTGLVEVTAHHGARPSHAEWQGKIYSVNGEGKYPDFYLHTGYGTGEGLCGYNCRHNFFPYYEGSPRAYTDEDLAEIERQDGIRYEFLGRDYNNYEAGQRQRAYERIIREQKRTIASYDAVIKTLKDKAEIDYYKNELLWTSVKLKRSEAEMKLFCKATNRKIDTTRSQVHALKDDTGRIVAFNKSISQKARHTAIKHHNDWLKSIGAENSTLNTLEKYYKGKYNKSDEYMELMLKKDLTKAQFPSEKSLKGHFSKHGEKLAIETVEEYKSKAMQLLRRTDKGVLHHGNQDGRRVVYNKKHGEVAILDKHKIRTYFKPDNGEEYYWDQFRKDVLKDEI